MDGAAPVTTAVRWPGRAAGLALACHPGPVVAVTSLACALAAGVGLSPGRFALVGAAVLAGQLSVGWCNDCLLYTSPSPR
ncbi:hypothetical protein EF908_19875, partial [Streptomyces sp. WAC04770]